MRGGFGFTLKARKRCTRHLFLHGVELRRGIAYSK